MAKNNKWDAIFGFYNKCTFDDIAGYVDEVAPDYADILAEQIEEKLDFISIKRAFYKKYYPDCLPVEDPEKKAKKEKMAKWLATHKQ